ncbi:MAG TPA: hypothetical protein DE314_05900 [Sulfitobacter sp.]|nr:hypothetical protein [Sulfitobacter sp.]
MSDAEATFYDIGHGIAETDASQMFGKKCFKVCKGGKPFVSFFEECMVFKLLGDDHAQALALDGAHLFDPSGKGRAMKEWVQVPHIHVAHWPSFADASHRYVSTL